MLKIPPPARALLRARYRLGPLLGKGGMGEVYRSQDLVLDREVALKRLTSRDSDALDQFEQEARILARLSHPGLPRVTDYFCEDGAVYLVMDFIDGLDLEGELSRDGALDPGQVVGWMVGLLDVLDYVHSQGVVHRDVKPSNIKVAPPGRTVVLVDFGISKTGGARAATRLGAIGFTPAISPPEQCLRTDSTGPWSDLYAVGATAYYLLTGAAPAESPARLMGTHLTPPSRLRPDLPAGLDGPVLWAMELQPQDRPADAAALKREFLECSSRRFSARPTAFRRDIRR